MAALLHDHVCRGLQLLPIDHHLPWIPFSAEIRAFLLVLCPGTWLLGSTVNLISSFGIHNLIYA